ncbi:hypothetical protein NDU88_006434 [Pleurodeles waltl]|uniref:Uncharacterized protein n=1 Tax=Pleurodeles waltl TaxID=8319 RepID=A0AAV7MDF1_PLEWA|nr:hypothetical protein NDU88_006434 [Pleurodeles waltl]
MPSPPVNPPCGVESTAQHPPQGGEPVPSLGPAALSQSPARFVARRSVILVPPCVGHAPQASPARSRSLPQLQMPDAAAVVAASRHGLLPTLASHLGQISSLIMCAQAGWTLEDPRDRRWSGSFGPVFRSPEVQKIAGYLWDVSGAFP